MQKKKNYKYCYRTSIYDTKMDILSYEESKCRSEIGVENQRQMKGQRGGGKVNHTLSNFKE